MRNSIRILTCALFTLSIACGDDGQTDTGTETETEAGDGDGDAGDGDGDGGDGDGDAGDGDGDAGDGDGDAGDGDGDAGDGDGDGGDGDGDGGDGDGDGGDGDGDGDGDACEPLTDDPSAIGVPCGNGLMLCPPEYTCQPFAGIVLQESCQILCAQDCECPDGYTCEEVADKGNMWMQCTAP
jgi:hypothetical protein